MQNTLDCMCGSKLKEYQNLDENDFVSLSVGKSIEEQAKEIQEIRYRMNRTRELRKSLGIENSEDSTFLKESQTRELLEKNDMIGVNERERYVARIKDATVNSFMQTRSDMTLIKNLIEISIIQKTGNETELANKIKNFEEWIGFKRESKFFQNIIDTEGNFDLNKSMQFLDSFLKDRNLADINRKLDTYETKGAEKSDSLAVLLIKSRKIDDPTLTKRLLKVAEDANIDIIGRNGELSIQKLNNYCKKVFGRDADLDELTEKYGFYGQNALDFIEHLQEKALTMEDRQIANNYDEVQQLLSESEKNEKNLAKVLCSKKEFIIYNVLDSQNAGNTKGWKNFYEKPENAKQLIMLYARFKQEELADRKEELSVNNIGENAENSIPGIIQKYLAKNANLFKEYVEIDGTLKSENIWKVVNEHETNTSQYASNEVSYLQIKRRTNEIERKEKENALGIRKIQNFLDGESKLSENEVYILASKLPTEILSTEMLNDLKRNNEDLFQEVFKGKNLERNVGKDSLSSIYFSAARLFTKGIIAIPKIIVSQNAREEYIPKIQSHIKSGMKRIGNIVTNSNNKNDYQEIDSNIDERRETEEMENLEDKPDEEYAIEVPEKKGILNKIINAIKRKKTLPASKEQENEYGLDEIENQRENSWELTKEQRDKVNAVSVQQETEETTEVKSSGNGEKMSQNQIDQLISKLNSQGEER